MTSDYRLTYEARDTPRHYGFRGRFEVPRTLERYRKLSSGEPAIVPAALASDDSAQALAAELAPQVERVVAGLDERGRWLDEGMINSATFIANVDLLARYIAAANGQMLPPLALLSR